MRTGTLSTRRLARLTCAATLTLALAGAGANAASATTFYVNGAVAASGDCLSAGSACKTINEAVAKARLVIDTATINVAAGTYTEDLELNKDGDAGLTIDGAGSAASGGTIIKGENGKPTIKTEPLNAGPTTIENLRVVNPVGDTSAGLEFVISPFALGNVAVEMLDPGSGQSAISGTQTTATLDQVSVGGPWTGPALTFQGSVTITRSSFTANVPALRLIEGTTAGGHRDLISDSTVQSGGTAAVNVEATGVDLTIDSSLLLGGKNLGINWVHPFQKLRDLTIDGSTIDAGALGVRDALPVSDVFAVVAGSPGTTGSVNIEGSILLESQTATLGGAGNQLTVNCSYSDVPNQAQASDGTSKGAINCANGASGNVTTEPLSSLFLAPGSNYQLNPSSSAVDSVPASAIVLPFGLTPAATDLAGAPRVVDGNGDCVAVQDKGAFELQGHAAACPVAAPAVVPPPPKPVAGVISALTISPSAFYAAPSGATISARKKYGATISYRDSQVATTTFTVLRPIAGRKQGKSCKRPSRSNRRGKRCTLYVAAGSFTHADKAGKNSLHFSGRLKGRKLARGAYRLQAVPHDAAGNGAAVLKGFTIR